MSLASTSSSPLSSSSDGVFFSDYELDFDRMYFEVPEIKNIFATFASEIAHVGECISFFDRTAQWLAAVQQQQASNNTAKWISELLTMATEIIDDFIRENSKSEVNLPGETRAATLLKLGELQQATSNDVEIIRNIALQLFRSSRHVVFMSLKYDVFPRFVRSDFLRNQLEPMLRDSKRRKHALFLLEQCGVLKSKQDAEKYVFYSADEILSDRVNARDIQFAKALLQDSTDFQLRYVSKDGTVLAYYSDKQFIKDESMHGNWSCHKMSFYVPANIFELLAASYDSSGCCHATHSIDFRQAGYLPPLDPSNPESRASSIMYMIIRPPTPLLQPRYVKSAVSMWMDTSEGRTRVYTVIRPTNSSLLPQEIPGCTYGRVLSGICYEYITENVTRFSQVVYANLGGVMATSAVSKHITRNAVKQRVKLQQKGCNKAIKLYRSRRTFPECDDNVGMLATLRDFCERNIGDKSLWPPMFTCSKPDGSSVTVDRSKSPFTFDEVEKFRKGGEPILKSLKVVD